MSDAFGIPDNVFGTVPEVIYCALGRVVALGALVEMRLGQVVMELARLPESEVAGQQMGQLMERIDKLSKRRVESGTPLPARLLALVEETGRAMRHRNELVHSLWANPTLADARGWRPAKTNDRVSEANPIAWVRIDEAGLRAFVFDLVRLARELRDVVHTTGAAP